MSLVYGFSPFENLPQYTFFLPCETNERDPLRGLIFRFFGYGEALDRVLYKTGCPMGAALANERSDLRGLLDGLLMYGPLLEYTLFRAISADEERILARLPPMG